MIGTNDDGPELAPREDFTHWLASDEPAAKLGRWVVYRLPAVGLGKTMDDRLEAIYGSEPRTQIGTNAWFWDAFESVDDSGWRHKPAIGPLCLHDRATGKLYHVSSRAQSLFESINQNETREPERKIIGALHDRAKAIVAERLAEPAIREQTLKAFADKGEEAFSDDELLELMGSTFIATGGFGADFVADAISRHKIVEPWGPALAEWLDDEDAAARRRADGFLDEEAAWLGEAIRRQQEWDEAVCDHGSEVSETMGLNASMHAALLKLDAKQVDLVFEAPQGEVVAKTTLQTLLNKLERGRPLSISTFEASQIDDCSAVLENGEFYNRYYAIRKLKAVRFRKKDVWSRIAD